MAKSKIPILNDSEKIDKICFDQNIPKKTCYWHIFLLFNFIHRVLLNWAYDELKLRQEIEKHMLAVHLFLAARRHVVFPYPPASFHERDEKRDGTCEISNLIQAWQETKLSSEHKATTQWMFSTICKGGWRRKQF